MKKTWPLIVALLLLLLAPLTAVAQGCGSSNPNCLVPMPPAAANNNQAAPTSWVRQTIGSSAVTSFNGRTGAVVPTLNDYNFNQLAGSLGCPQMPTLSGDLSNANCVLTLAGIITAGGPLGSATRTPTVTWDAKGRVTVVTDQAIDLHTVPGQFGSSAANHAVPVDVAGASVWKVIPDCQDSAGNHINYTQSTDAFSCGTSGGSAAGFYTLQYIAAAWACAAPDGSSVNIAGSTTNGLQECINAMQTNKTGNFRAVCPPNHPIAAATTVTFGPAGEGYNYTLNGCILTSSATNSVIVDTFAQGSSLLWDGHIHYEGNSGYAVQIQPANPDPTNGGYVTIGANIYLPEIDIHNSSCTTGSVVALLRFDTTQHSTSAIVNNLISVAGLDGGPSNCNSYGVYVDTPTNTFQGFGQNIIRILINGSFSNSGFNVCNSSSNTNSCATNDWTTSITITSAVTNMVLTGGFLDTWHILSASINAGSCTNGIFFVGGGTQTTPTGAYGNAIYSTQIGCTNPIVMGNSLMNSIVNPGQGGAWAPFTPSLTCTGGTLNSASATGRYQITGHTVDYSMTITITTATACTTTAGGSINATLPLIAKANSVSVGRETSSSGNLLVGMIVAASATVLLSRYDATCPDCVSGRAISVSGAYEFQ